MSNDVHVDPTVLETLSRVFDEASAAVESINPQAPGSIGAGLPGSQTASACTQAEGVVGQALSNVAKRIGQMGYLVRGSKQDYVATDEQIGSGFDAMGDLP